MQKMLQNFIKNIRAKPASVRKGITLGVSLGVTAIASFFWFISFIHYSTEVMTAESPVESPTNFLGRMSTLIGESYANVRTKIDPVVSGSAFVGATSTASTTAGAMATSAASMSAAPSTQPSNGSADSSNDVGNASNTSVNVGESKSLNDILNTKSRDNQDAKATTSGEVLVQ